MNLQKYSGCSLEVFDQAIADMRYCTDVFDVGATVTRYIAYNVQANYPIYNLGLDGFLGKVDGYFNTITAAIGASVVQHEWCLIKSEQPPPLRACSLGKFGLQDYFLGARVEVLAGTPLPTLMYEKKSKRSDIEKELMRSGRKFFRKNGWWVRDALYQHQFMKDTSGEADLTLFDIEPRINIDKH